MQLSNTDVLVRLLQLLLGDPDVRVARWELLQPSHRVRLVWELLFQGKRDVFAAQKLVQQPNPDDRFRARRGSKSRF